MIIYNPLGDNKLPREPYNEPHLLLSDTYFRMAVPNYCNGDVAIVKKVVVGCLDAVNDIYKTIEYCKDKFYGKPYISVYVGDIDNLAPFDLYLDDEHYYTYEDLLNNDDVEYNAPIAKIYLPKGTEGKIPKIEGGLLLNNKVCYGSKSDKYIDLCLPIGCYWIVIMKDGVQEYISNPIVVKKSIIESTMVDYYLNGVYIRELIPIEITRSVYEFEQDEKVLSNGTKSFTNKRNFKYISFRTSKKTDEEIDYLLSILQNPSLRIYAEGNIPFKVQIDGGLSYSESTIGNKKGLSGRFLLESVVGNTCFTDCGGATLKIKIHESKKEPNGNTAIEL